MRVPKINDYILLKSFFKNNVWSKFKVTAINSFYIVLQKGSQTRNISLLYLSKNVDKWRVYESS